MDDDKCITLLNLDTVEADTLIYNGLLPSPALIQPPTIPPISTLVTSIIASSDRLFFTSHSLGNPSVYKWHLVCVAFSDSTALSLSCLQDRRFLVEFYTLHHHNVCSNAIDQRYWLQYHLLGNLTNPTSTTTMHLIRPSDTSEALAMKQKLVPFCCWSNLTHLDTYLHGPFNFATVKGWKTRVRTAQHDWDILSCQAVQFQNLLPWFDLPSYSIHIDHGVYITICDSLHTAALCAVSNLDINCSYH
jgi:hypothetical protein